MGEMENNSPSVEAKRKKVSRLSVCLLCLPQKILSSDSFAAATGSTIHKVDDQLFHMLFVLFLMQLVSTSGQTIQSTHQGTVHCGSHRLWCQFSGSPLIVPNLTSTFLRASCVCHLSSLNSNTRIFSAFNMRILLQILLMILIPVIHGHELLTSKQMRTGNAAVIDEPGACDNKSTVILVKSAITHFHHRMAIRETWAKQAKDKFGIPVLFVVGQSDDQDSEFDTMTESQQYCDILMGNFTDTYWNTTLKTVFVLNWYATRCGNSLLVYIDDDVIVNPAKLTQFLAASPIRTGVHCSLMHNDWPARDPGSVHYVSLTVWPDPYWPDYCSGAAVIMNKQTAQQLVAGALDDNVNPKLFIDDVFVYGIVRQRFGVPITAVPSIRVFGFDQKVENMSQVYDKSIIIGQFKWYNMTDFWGIPETEVTDKVTMLAGRRVAYESCKTDMEESRLTGRRPIQENIWVQIVVLFLVMVAFMCMALYAFHFKIRVRKVAAYSTM